MSFALERDRDREDRRARRPRTTRGDDEDEDEDDARRDCAKGKKDDEDDEIDPEEIELDAMERMEKTMDAIANDFSTVRTGRANAAILDRIEVDYYGAPTPAKTIATRAPGRADDHDSTLR